MRTAPILLLPLLTLLAPNARAEDTQVVLSAGFLVNQGSTIDLTGETTGGYTVELGALFAPKDFGPKIMVYAGLLNIPAANPAPGGSNFTMSGQRFGADLVYQPWDEVPVTIRTGPSLHIWQVNAKAGSAIDGVQDQGLKEGWRLGVGYDFHKAWSASCYYTFTEWRSDPNQPVGNGNPARPNYFSFMASYRF
jgi:hypothetical protein